MSRTRSTLSLLAPCLAVLACAQATPPPGGVPDRMPPSIIATTPDTLAVVPAFEGPVVFRFNERISERGITDASALVSPRTGDVRVKRGSDELRVELDGGWKPGLIYRVLLMPGVRDLFGNEIKQPSELVFSTGPEIAGSVIAGVVTDRITGRPAPHAFIDATLSADSITYVTTVDTLSFYAFRYMTPGLYQMVAWVDQNRNGRHDTSDPASLPVQRSVEQNGDTVVVELAVVPYDTTAPRLTRGEPRDSLDIRLFSDDYLEPTAQVGLARVTIRELPDSVEVPGPHALMTVDSFNKLPKPEPDTAARDTLAAARDTLAAARDTSAAARDTSAAAAARADSLAKRGPPGVGRALPPGRSGLPGAGGTGRNPFDTPEGPLPYRELVLVPATPLRPGTTYRITVEGLTNISALSNGGGEVEVTMPEAKPPPPDTSGVRPARRPVR